MQARTGERGFTLIEMLVVLLIIGVIVIVALPSTARTLSDLRLRSDARSIHNMVGLAKMRAGSRFTRERVYVDLSTSSYYLQYWDKTASSWVTEGGTSTLSSGVSFGTADVDGAPPDTQSTFGQAAACRDSSNEAISGTACVVFNSRGIPIDSTASPTGNTAFYLTDEETGVYAITISATPLVRLWWSPSAFKAWVKR
jgi:prepilin-type N-terminal cleavage/methylation domain-containing protein